MNAMKKSMIVFTVAAMMMAGAFASDQNTIQDNNDNQTKAMSLDQNNSPQDMQTTDDTSNRAYIGSQDADMQQENQGYSDDQNEDSNEQYDEDHDDGSSQTMSQNNESQDDAY
ncbi:MAG: hypothetical protein ACO2ZM_08110 [Francisellaceae bacterium]